MELGARATVDLVVTDADTAIALGSGDVPVLGTPRVVALVERATVAALTLEEGQTSVGTRVQLEHLAPTPVGRSVVATADLVAIEGRRLTFEVTVHDGQTLAARGTVERVVVDRGRFLERL
jgi:predicted thioesterase